MAAAAGAAGPAPGGSQSWDDGHDAYPQHYLMTVRAAPTRGRPAGNPACRLHGRQPAACQLHGALAHSAARCLAGEHAAAPPPAPLHPAPPAGRLSLPPPPPPQVASQAASSRHLRCGAAATIGWRPYMEDTLVLEPAWLPQRRLGLLAVFDGHGGAESARFCAHHLVRGVGRRAAP